MDRRDYVKTGAFAALASATVRAQEDNYHIGAYYFPNFHVDEDVVERAARRIRRK
jgi:hypothetical protein